MLWNETQLSFLEFVYGEIPRRIHDEYLSINNACPVRFRSLEYNIQNPIPSFFIGCQHRHL